MFQSPQTSAELPDIETDFADHPTAVGEDFDKDRAGQSLRRQRKDQGLPAPEDVETLSIMFKTLRAAAESLLGHDIPSALAVTQTWWHFIKKISTTPLSTLD
jgi:hypothetical protein